MTTLQLISLIVSTVAITIAVITIAVASFVIVENNKRGENCLKCPRCRRTKSTFQTWNDDSGKLFSSLVFACMKCKIVWESEGKKIIEENLKSIENGRFARKN